MTNTKLTMTKNPREAKQFISRKAAEQAVRSIGWSLCDVRPIEIMGFRMWAIMDPHTNMLTPEGFDYLANLHAQDAR